MADYGKSVLESVKAQPYSCCTDTKATTITMSLKSQACNLRNILLVVMISLTEYEPEASMPIVQDSNLSNLGPILPGVLAANGEESPAHKPVLPNPVFRAMLRHKAVESTQNKVTIADIEPKVLEQLLRFIYTDSVADLDMAFELLQAADKYDLEKLKTRCEVALCGQISEETAVHTLVLADLYRADQLKRAAVNFIGRNVGVIQTEDWKKLMLKNFELANGVMIELLEGTQLK
ncbi:speckle-type POZ protein B [Culex quinquefasciatus]|uniref:Speckle-type POZ protein B n=1 Tax=Culex quinquefasciatus TaxID=7176 RepID=B0WAZ4_CULQU|nr:speckle-type POZ protein B [Culex quinquefasciatus]|eukprot:XP_001845878.1 speckle-type POZ protein B [Culex quinquefasciatus]